MGTEFFHIDLQRAGRNLAEASRFGLVGVSNTLVDALLYFALSGGWVPVLVLPRAAAKAAGYLAGVVNSYYWNRRWTFRSRRAVRQTFMPFFLTNLVGLVINVLLLQICIGELRLQEQAAVFFATLGAVIWSFTINKFVIFGKPQESACSTTRTTETTSNKEGRP